MKRSLYDLAKFSHQVWGIKYDQNIKCEALPSTDEDGKEIKNRGWCDWIFHIHTLNWEKDIQT